ncbi:Uncharacterised protein [Serratia liquefaciens]|jgi:hypothetical protein|nr:Uncharacterised protein [Serratia liquefaciens]CAI1159088.1 Uncharacterised protein [Serratia liquefaciens]
MHTYVIKSAVLSGVSGVFTILLINLSQIVFIPKEINYIQILIIIFTFLGVRSFLSILINIYNWYTGDKKQSKALH